MRALLCAAFASWGCETSSGSPPTSDVGSALGGSSSVSGASAGSTAQGPFRETYLQASARRMTVREFSNTVVQLLGTEREFSSVLPHDMPQEGYSRNQAQLVDPVFGRQLQYTAEQLAAEAVAQRLSVIAPVQPLRDPTARGRSFVTSGSAPIVDRSGKRSKPS